jgi:hypothetical protein
MNASGNNSGEEQQSVFQLHGLLGSGLACWPPFKQNPCFFRAGVLLDGK